VWTIGNERVNTLRTIRAASASSIVAVFICQTKSQTRLALGSLCQDGTLAMHDLESGVTLCSYPNRICTVGSPRVVATMRGGRLLAVAGHSAAIHVMDLFTDSSTHLFSGHHDWVTVLTSFESDVDSTLFSYSDDCMLGLWKWRNGTFEIAQRIWLSWPSTSPSALSPITLAAKTVPRLAATSHSQVFVLTNAGQLGLVSLSPTLDATKTPSTVSAYIYIYIVVAVVATLDWCLCAKKTHPSYIHRSLLNPDQKRHYIGRVPRRGLSSTGEWQHLSLER